MSAAPTHPAVPRDGRAAGRRDAGFFALLSAVFAVSALVPAAVLARLPSVCLLHAAGLPCASCGLSRGFCALSHGDFAAAVAYNPRTPYVYAGLALLWLFYGLRLAAPALRRARALLAGRLV